MTVDEWGRWATADAERRNLPQLKPLLEAFARSLRSLRAADFNERADGGLPASGDGLQTSPGSADHKVETPGADELTGAKDPRPGASIEPEARSPEPAETIEVFGARLRRGDITSSEITERCLQHIERDDARLNAFILVMADEARAQARAADDEIARGIDRGPLHGVPISLKDLLDVRGTPTSAASRVRQGHVAQRDALVVARLREAGAVLIGKTNLHEFAFGTTSEESAFGPVRNPLDVRRSSGGSSGGSAVSVAAGMALASIGTDTGGSIRIPAAACGIVGLKPAFGEIDTDGVVPLSVSLDHVGPQARSVADAWSVYRALLADHRPVGVKLPAGRAAHSMRLGVLRRHFCDLLDHDVRGRFEASLDRLRAAGARMDDAEIPHAADIAPVYMTIVYSEAAAYHAATLEAMPERYSRHVRMRLEVGRYLAAEDLTRALRGREVLRREVDAALASVDALVLPTLPIPAPELGIQSLQIGGVNEPVRNLMLRNTQLFNLSGHPAITLSCGMTAAGLPCGIQLIGCETEALLGTALIVEHLLGSD